MTKLTIARLIVVLTFVTSIPLLAGQTMVVLKGTVTGTLAPGKVDMVFTDESGSKIRSSSATDGSYQAVLKAGHHYTVLLTDQDLQRFTLTYDTPASEKYAELTYNFVVRPPAPVVTESATKTTKKKSKTKKSSKR